MKDRIKFFSVNDLSIGFYLELLKKKLDEFDDTIEYNDINDVLELKNIKQFVENNIFHKDWTEQEIGKYRNMNFLKVIRKFFGNITDENIMIKLSEVDTMYREDFWEIFDSFKIYKKIEKNTFKDILDSKRYTINYILYYKSIVQYYDDVIKSHLLSHNDDSVELYLDEYFELKENNQKPIFFPLSLTKEEKEEQLNLYVTEDFKKFNYFQIILKSFSHQELGLSPLLKRNVKKVYDKLLDNYFKASENVFTYGYNVKFQKEQFSDKIYSEKNVDSNFIAEMKYSLDWITENLDYPTLLNNFIYLFELVDKYFIFTNLNYEREFGVFEKALVRRGIKEYTTGSSFDFKKMKSESDLKVYYKILKENNIRLEDILEWFFKEYLLNEFGIKNFSINLPTENLTYLEKCKCIFSEIEKVLKQFELYKDYNEIDSNILELLTDQINFENIGSLLEKKYVYINSKNKTIMNILYYLFSNQSDLRFIGDNLECNNFIQLIAKEKINKSMLSARQLVIIDSLISENILQEDEKGNIGFNLVVIILLKELYEKEVLCINYLGEAEKKIGFLKDKDMIYYTNTLFAKKESDYLNYYLSSKFSNSYELRNKYAHGTYPLDEKQHMEDYFKFLEILILIVIKINEEFCLYDTLKLKNIKI